MAVATRLDRFVHDFERVIGDTRGAEPAEVQSLRRAALERFLAAGFPTRHDEAWRYTSVAPIAETEFEPAGQPTVPVTSELERLVLPDVDVAIFVDGRFMPSLSRLDSLPEGVRVGSLAAALLRDPEHVSRHLGGDGLVDGSAFAALNSALFRDGAFVHLPRGAALSRPLQLVFVGTADGRPTVAYPRVLTVVDEGAEATIVETHASSGEGVHLACGVAELALAQGARLERYVLQRESDAAFHVGAESIRLARDASVASTTFTLGGGLVRNDIRAELTGEGASLVLNGLYYAGGTQHVDTHMVVEHAAPHGESHELYKGVLDGRASAAFNGLIHVHPGAQKTNAKQSNRNLLLSRDALANSNPQLRIFADDVKCTHGSTVGRLDEDAIFYLRSRGIGHEAARALLTRAFAGEVVAQVKPAALRAQLDALLAERLPLLEGAGGA